jgi:hypothetical protein
MKQIQIPTISGETPIDVYVSDYSRTTQLFLGSVNTPTSLPVNSSLFNTMDNVLLIMSASNGCQTIRLLPCTPQHSSTAYPTPTPTTTPTPTL